MGDDSVDNASYMAKDLIDGDESVTARKDFSELSQYELNSALHVILDNPSIPDKRKKELMMNIWRVHYRVKPPSIEEFLTVEWIGPTAENLYDHVSQWLIDFWQPHSPYRHLLLSTSIGTGKSLTSAISSLFVTTHLWAMRDPKKFFGLSQATSIVHALISFTMEKAGQLLLQPFFQILLSSKKFQRIRQEEKLVTKQREEYPNQVCWTSAGRMGQLQFYNDVHYMLASSPQKLLGLNMISAILSEISFFLDQGFSSEYIWRIYQDSKARVQNRFENQRFSGTIIDSSPNDMENSPIDKYIFSGEAEKVPENYVITGAHWEFLPQKYPEYNKTGSTFPLFKGSNKEPPRILTDTEESDYNEDDLFRVPIDIKQLFIEEPLKNTKDYCGWPAGSQGRLIQEEQAIEGIFTPQLKNIYKYIHAPESERPEKLIWNAIKSRFFIEHSKGKYEFYRNAGEKRYIHIDQSEVKDATSITMLHPETDKSGNIVYITDFTIVIVPGKERINLDAIRFFMMDLRDIGRINIQRITLDQYQSSATRQYLKQEGFDCELLSVDRDINPYRVYIGKINGGRIRCGYNVFLKNNLKSLQEVTLNSGKKKIDHIKGKIVEEDGANWETSMMGRYAKDVTDSHCGALWSCIHHHDTPPMYVWEEDKEVGIEDKSPENIDKNFKSTVKKKMLNEIKEKYGYVVAS